MPSLYAAGAHGRIRVRETYVRDFVAPQITLGAPGVVKLDLVLRALSDERGLIPDTVTWEHLHDWCRPATLFVDEPALKRKWVSEKLARLERLGLLARTPRPGGRSQLQTLRDDLSRAPIDDPGPTTDSYVTVLCDAIEYGRLAAWESPQIAAYFAAMIAERYARSDNNLDWLETTRPLGAGIWFRPMSWFKDTEHDRPHGHIRINFSERNLRRGFTALRKENLVASVRTRVDPRSGKAFNSEHGRIVYFNGFADLRPGRRLRFPVGPANLRAALVPPEDLAFLADL